MAPALSEAFTDLKRAWASNRVSPPLIPHAQVFRDEVEQQIAMLGAPGARQHFLIHGPDKDATTRLAKTTMAQLREDHPELRIVRLSFQARIYGSIAGVFDALISSITGGVISADLASMAKNPIKQIWKDKVHEFLTVAMQPSKTGQETQGVLIFADDYDALMQDVFDTPEKASLFRAFLQEEGQVIFVGVSKGQELDSDPDDRIFRLFRRWSLPLPQPAEMFLIKPDATPQFAALMATAQIMGAYERPFTTAIRTIDWTEKFDMEDLARSLMDVAQAQWAGDIEKLSSTRLAILQALITLGEPATASEIAERLNVAQSRIARHINDMKEEAILSVQSVAGRSKPVVLNERGMALAIKGLHMPLAFALNIAAGRHLAGDAIDAKVTALMAKPRAKRYAALKDQWDFKLKASLRKDSDAPALAACVSAAFLATLVVAYTKDCPDDISDLIDAAEAQKRNTVFLSEIVTALLDPNCPSELKRALRYAAGEL